MPVINPQRQATDLGSVQVQHGTQGMVQTAGMNTQEIRKAQNKAAVMGQFLQDFTGGFEKQVQVEGAQAAVQGALDAQGQSDALAAKDENVSKQNFLLQSYYKDGYVSAAASQQLAQYRTDSLMRVRDAVSSGMSDEDYAEQERKATAEFQTKMSSYLPDMSKQNAVSALSSLQQTSAANYKEFQTLRAKQAIVNADNALDKNLGSSVQEVNQRLQAGSFGDAQNAVISGMNTILGAQHLDKDKKLDRVKDYLTTIAQSQSDPAVIDQLQQLATKELGVHSVDVTKALYSEFKRAGNQMEGQVLFQLDDMQQQMKGLTDPDQRKALLDQNRQYLMGGVKMGVISGGTAVSAWDKMQKMQEESQKKYAFDDGILTGKTPATIAGSAGVDLDKARNQILQTFPDTAEGNIQLLQYGRRSKDNWAIDQAQGRLGKQAALAVSTLDQIAEDGQVSAENVATLSTFAQVYTQASDVGKMNLLAQIPDEQRGIVQKAIADNPADISGILLNSVRRQAQMKASGRYDQIQGSPSAKMIDASGTSNWFSFFGEADKQRSAASAAMAAEYKYLYQNNPEALRGRSAEDINDMLKGMVSSRKMELEVSGKSLFTFLPPGTNMQDFMGGAKTDPETFKQAMQQTIQQQVDAAIDPSNVDHVMVDAGTTGANGKGMSIAIMDKQQQMHYIDLDTDKVGQLAQSQYNAKLAGETEQGAQYRGMQPAHFADVDNKRALNLNVSGQNSVGLRPTVFAGIKSTLMEYEGFRGTKQKGSIGFGLHENSGYPIPETMDVNTASTALSHVLEKTYIPAVQKQLKGAGLEQDDNAMRALVDLNYHGGNGSTMPVVDAMKNFLEQKNMDINGASAGVFQALQSQPAFKQAQPARKKYLMKNMQDWVFSHQMDAYK